jgi:prevent-host-death family protein
LTVCYFCKKLADMEQYTSEDARREWRRILNKVDHGEHVRVTRYGEPTAVMVPDTWHRNMLTLKKAVLAFTRDGRTAHQLPGETEKPIGELLAAIGDDALRTLDEEPDLGD